MPRCDSCLYHYVVLMSSFFLMSLQFRHYFWPRLVVGTVWIARLDPAMRGGVHIAPLWKHGTRLAFLRHTESFYRVRNLRDDIRGLEPVGLYCRLLVAGNGGLRRSGFPHNSLHFPAESPAFISYFLAGFLLKARYDFGEFERSKQSVMVFKVNDDVILRGQ